MPKSRSRIKSKCKNCSVCEKIIEIHKHNDINKLLSEVTKWDIEVINQYKQITKFDCIVCNFKTNKFNDWKYHIMSVSHMSDCHKIKDLYSYVCSSKECKVLLYGPKESLLKHKKDKHSETNDITGIQVLMAEVWKYFINKKLKPLNFCSHCKKIDEKPIHTKNEIKGLINVIKYYCKFCRVTFCSSPEMLDYHTLSVEHMTIKCFDELCTKTEMNSKKIKLPDQLNKNKENILLPAIHESVLCTDSIHLPNVVLNRFQNTSQYYGKCKLCSISINWHSEQIRLHLLQCEYKFNLTGTNKTKISTFKCNVCDYLTNDISGHKSHIISLSHLTNCYDTENYYSYFCNVCNIYMYSDTISIKNHIKEMHKSTNIQEELPMLSTFMALTFKEFNLHPKLKKLSHYYGNKNKNEVSQNCLTCKVKFHNSIEEYEMHEITSEHIILKFLTTKVVLKNPNNSTTLNNTQIIKTNVIQEIPLFQKNTDNHLIQNVQLNKNQISVDNSAEIINNVENVQKSLTTSFCVEELDNDVQSINSKSNINIELMSNPESNYDKKQYTKYYEHKINLLNLLRQYRDRIIQTSSFYCEVCDFITEEKYTWDRHNKTEHSDDDRFSIYCSTCSMLIVCKNNEEHCSTTEHCNFLKFLQLEKYVKNTLNEKSVIKGTEKLELSNTSSTDEPSEYQYTKNNSWKNNDSLLKKEFENLENLVVISTSSLLDNNEHVNNDITINTSNSSNIVKSTFCTKLTQPTPNNAFANVLLADACKPNLDNIKIQTTVNDVDTSIYEDDFYITDSVDLVKDDTRLKVIVDGQLKHEVSSIFSESTLPLQTVDLKLLEKGKINDIDDDRVYGNYVTQRLKIIENIAIKDDIKLEIDNIFYTKIKQMSNNTKY